MTVRNQPWPVMNPWEQPHLGLPCEQTGRPCAGAQGSAEAHPSLLQGHGPGVTPWGALGYTATLVPVTSAAQLLHRGVVPKASLPCTTQPGEAKPALPLRYFCDHTHVPATPTPQLSLLRTVALHLVLPATDLLGSGCFLHSPTRITWDRVAKGYQTAYLCARRLPHPHASLPLFLCPRSHACPLSVPWLRCPLLPSLSRAICLPTELNGHLSQKKVIIPFFSSITPQAFPVVNVF